jgi:hypothetical protein
MDKSVADQKQEAFDFVWNFVSCFEGRQEVREDYLRLDGINIMVIIASMVIFLQPFLCLSLRFESANARICV